FQEDEIYTRAGGAMLAIFEQHVPADSWRRFHQKPWLNRAFKKGFFAAGDNMQKLSALVSGLSYEYLSSPMNTAGTSTVYVRSEDERPQGMIVTTDICVR